MLNLREDLLQFIWQHRLLKPVQLVTQLGFELSITKPGEPNTDAGPDFFNACINIDGVTLAGNVEVHIKTSDWLKHRHQHDAAYNNIILHVVYEHDIELEQNRSNNVQVLELKNYIAVETLEQYRTLTESKSKLACACQLSRVNNQAFMQWIDKMTNERLEAKLAHIEALFKESGNDYTQTFYTLLLRNFGFKVNALPFELLAKQLPANLLLKHADNVLQLEALLLGVAGLLEEPFENAHLRRLQNEFEYLRVKNGLIPLKKRIFKFSRLRPANFPGTRLAQLATLINRSPRVLTNPLSYSNFEGLKQQLTIKAEAYKKNISSSGKADKTIDATLGKLATENIIINTYVPFFYFYSKKNVQPALEQTARCLLFNCAFENNFKTRLFVSKKQPQPNAAISQGLINLHDNYCLTKKCLKCEVAVSILGSDAKQVATK